MRRNGISQEGLKLIACITMLADHIGAVFFPGSILRFVGRLAFPIYCFLLTEGACHTRNPRRYGFRLLIGLLISEIPYDFLFYGGWYWGKQSVMVSLLLGFLYCVAALRLSGILQRMLLLIPFAYLAELLRVDYGGWGIILIGMFLLTREQPGRKLIQTAMVFVICWMMSRAKMPIGTLLLPVQPFGVLAMVPIVAYNGQKVTKNMWVQRAFYLFYPLHLAVLYCLKMI